MNYLAVIHVSYVNGFGFSNMSFSTKGETGPDLKAIHSLEEYAMDDARKIGRLPLGAVLINVIPLEGS